MGSSGKFVLRAGQHLHERLVKKSRDWNVSLNETCLRLLDTALSHLGDGQDRYFSILHGLKNRFKGDLWGVLVFGSQVQHQGFNSSDVDFMILLNPKITLSRALYQFWDEKLNDGQSPVINPHFVHPPKNDLFGSLWLEVAQNHRILFDKKSTLHNIIVRVQDFVLLGNAKRETSHGQPYWIRSQHAQS